MAKHYLSRILVVFVIAVFPVYHLIAQEEDNKLDNVSDDVIESVYQDEPEMVSNDTTDQKKRSSFNAYPYAFYTPESKFAVGAGGIFIFYLGKEKELRPSKIGFGGYYSSNKQYKLSVSPVLYLFDNKLYIEAPTSYGYFINKYWGIGDATPEYDSAGYAIKTFTSTLTVQVPPRVFSADRTGIILDVDITSIDDKMGNEFLQNDSLPGYDGGKLIGFGTDLVWDSRDNIFFPEYRWISIF